MTGTFLQDIAVFCNHCVAAQKQTLQNVTTRILFTSSLEPTAGKKTQIIISIYGSVRNVAIMIIVYMITACHHIDWIF